MNLCDTCPQPGHCCKSIHLSGGGLPTGSADKQTALEALVEMAKRALPFVASEKREYWPGHLSWWYTCPLLDNEGRCSDYENRPDLCREYQPLEDGLCVLHHSRLLPLLP